MKTKILQDIFSEVEWEKVWKTLIEFYPSQSYEEKDYFEVFWKIIGKVPVIDDMYLDISYIEEENSEDNYYDVCGVRDGDDNSYAIEYIPWDEWAGLKINEKLKWEYEKEEIVAHSLYELTYCGFVEEEIQARFKEIMDDINEIENMTEEELEERTVTVDDNLFNDVDELVKVTDDE